MEADAKIPESEVTVRKPFCRRFWKYQKHTEEFYASKRVTIFFAILIVANFTVSCCNKQFDPDTEKYIDLWAVFELFFNIAFTVELAINMYGSWFLKFVKSAWNIFDLTVVSIGLTDMLQIPLPEPLKLVRMLRAFRVFRLFGRVESLKKILMMIHRAIPGVISAFVLNFIVLCIYAVLAVDFFRDIHDDCHDLKAKGLPLPPGAMTVRAKCFGDDYYGSFLKSLFTLYQILTGESWSEAAVRPVLHFYERSWYETMGVATFFISFLLINAVVLLNVVVAVLIEGMNGGEEEEEKEDEEEEEEVKEGLENKDQLPKDDAGQIVISLDCDQNTNGATHTDHRSHESQAKIKDLTSANKVIAEDMAALQEGVGSMKSQLQAVSAEIKESCSTIMAELKERHEGMSKRHQALNAGLNRL